MRRIVFDAVLLAAYALVAVPALTGIGAHEWLGVAVVAALLAHCARRGAAPARGAAAAGRAVLNGLIVVALAACAVSGAMVSGAVLPALGLYARGYFFWDPLHAVSAKVLLALVVVHVALHAKWIVGILGRGGRRRGKLDAADAADAAEGR